MLGTTTNTYKDLKQLTINFIVYLMKGSGQSEDNGDNDMFKLLS